MLAGFAGLSYGKFFFRCPLTASEPRYDLQFMNILQQYSADQPTWRGSWPAFPDHYLAEEARVPSDGVVWRNSSLSSFTGGSIGPCQWVVDGPQLQEGGGLHNERVCHQWCSRIGVEWHNIVQPKPSRSNAYVLVTPPPKKKTTT